MEAVIPYIAGILDGEGTITLSKEKTTAKYRHLIVSVSSTTFEILVLLKNHYGGSISKHKTYHKHHKQSWSWKLSNRSALKLIKDVYPFLIVPEKQYRAKICLQFYLSVTPRNGKYSQTMHEAKIAFEHKFFHPSTALHVL